MWSEDTRSLVPSLPPISTAAMTSPSRHSQSSLDQGDKIHHYEHYGNSTRRRVLGSVDDLEQRQRADKELAFKVNELFAELSRMKVIVGHLDSERTSQDVWLKESFCHVREQLSWLSQKMDNALTTLSHKIEQLEQRTAIEKATEHAQLTSSLTSAVEQNKKWVWEYSNKMRETIEEEISGLEKAFHKECRSQLSYSTQVDNKLCGQIGELQRQVDLMQDNTEKERVKCGSQFSGVSNSLSVVATSCRVSNEELSSVLNAEIKTRQSEMSKVQSQYQKIHGMCRSSIASIREGLLSLEERFADDRKDAQLLNDKLLQEWQGMTERMQLDMSARMAALHQHISSVSSSHQLDHGSGNANHVTMPLTHAEDVKPERKNNVVESDSKPPAEQLLTSELASLQKEIERQSERVNDLGSLLHNFQLWVGGAMQRETGERCQSVIELKQEIANLQAQLLMTFAALNIPQSNNNTHFIQLPQPATHPQLQPHFGTEISQFQQHFREEGLSNDTSSNHPPSFREDGIKEIIHTPVDNGMPERPTGVTTTAFSPFPEVGERKGPSYLSDGDGESETATESEGDDETFINQRRKYHDESAAALSQSPLTQRQVVTSSDPLETSLESHSQRSSFSEVPQMQHQTRGFPLATEPRVAQGYVMNHNNKGFDLQSTDLQDELESSGRFTSASATPDSQQKVLVKNRTRQQSDSGEAGEEQIEREKLCEPDEETREIEEMDSQLKDPVGSLHDQSTTSASDQRNCEEKISLVDTKDSTNEQVKDNNVISSSTSRSGSMSDIRQDAVMVASANHSEQLASQTADHEDNVVDGNTSDNNDN